MRCLEIMGEENRALCNEEVLGEPPPPPPLLLCMPDRALTWADYTGAPRGRNSAETVLDYDLVTEQRGEVIRVTLNSGRSFVRPKFANPTDSAVNTCDAQIAGCETHFDREAAAGRTGATYRLRLPGGCPAAIGPDPTIIANSRADCASLLAPECNRVAPLESARLLHHEQLHFDIGCVLARKGTTALANPPRGGSRAVLAAVRLRHRQININGGRYDNQTGHGCNAAAQSTWDADVAAGLPSIAVP